ncbi:hypothetical protein [Propioniferax innocua]|uniref:hypothetical protein n=1 Tax=Propioniferax innocua TaxID=1753 RepID=UPI0031D9066C
MTVRPDRTRGGAAGEWCIAAGSVRSIWLCSQWEGIGGVENSTCIILLGMKYFRFLRCYLRVARSRALRVVEVSSGRGVDEES